MYSSKNVLLVSPYPYSISSRGMDVLTKSFDDEGWNVTHLTFPKAFYTPKVTKPENSKVNTIEARNSIFPYIDRIMFWFPKLLFDIVKWFNNRTVKNIDFSQYDYIVLESGKALFLMDLIPENVPIIYRLSDSVQLVLGKNKYYKELENIIFKRSFKMIFKKEVYKNFLNDIEKNKTTVIENGMVIPKEIHSGNTYPDGSINAVYVGLHQLDFLTVSSLVRECSNCDFHIIGPCLSKKQVGKLEINKNFHYYPFLSKEEYMPLVKDATLAIFPFRRTESMKWFGLTSKLLHFMYFNLPIVLYPTGVEGEFNNLPVYFADSRESFVTEVKDVILKGEKITYNLDFDYYSSDSREKEYKKFIRTL